MMDAQDDRFSWTLVGPCIFLILGAVGCTQSSVATSPNAAVVVDRQSEKAKSKLKKTQDPKRTVRIATFNCSLNRETSGALARELQSGQSAQAAHVAEIIQRVAPDILVLQEFDYDKQRLGIESFQENFLAKSQNGAPALRYPYTWQAPVNTGLATGIDLSRNGRTDGPDDAQGFGKHHGQYGFVILSKHPLVTERIRTFQKFLWKDMPGALLPTLPGSNGAPFYTPAALNVLRLSSKNHVDVPIRIGATTLHILAAHPTPPVFDGPENRNGLRNHDEIRLIADYIGQNRADYLIDDNGLNGGLTESASFVIAGDMNADPVDGDSTNQAIHQLLKHPRVNRHSALGAQTPSSVGGSENVTKPNLKGNPKFHTAGWGLRVDYVLPSSDLTIKESGIFWPPKGHELHYLVEFKDNRQASSDHRLVWIDLEFAKSKP